MSASVRIAVLGIGEAGTAISRDLVEAGADVRGYDPKDVEFPAAVAVRTSEADAVRDAELVLSVNSSHDAMTALRNAVPGLRPGTLWADLNTASPNVKAALVEAAPEGVPVVDVALMSVVPGNGMRTPMVVSGQGAQRYADIFAELGVAVDVLPGPAGAAISRKLLRSVFWKGVAAAVVEALTAAEAAGVRDWLHGNIAAEMAGFDERSVDALFESTHTHARRRADEMAAAAEQLTDLGVTPRVTAAARDQFAALRDGQES
jgi:3-hydroxyisobutyrate dehydrogenase-like beta-hydroxyacid dehydrogenase